MSSLPYDYFIKSMGKSNLLDNNAAQLPFFSSKYDDALICRGLLLNCLSKNYSELWNELFSGKFNSDAWAIENERLNKETFSSLSSEWNMKTPIRNDFERRMALIEIDVLTAMALGLSCDELKLMYKIQFPVLQSYEEDTWYDKNGRIIFTNNRSLSGVGLSRGEWEKVLSDNVRKVEHDIEDNNIGDISVHRTVEYYSPFEKFNREIDYEKVWEAFERRFE